MTYPWSRPVYSILLGLQLIMVSPLLNAQDIVKNKSYDLWVSQSFSTPPYAPFHDCLRFPPQQACLDLCGDCGNVVETRLGLSLTLWSATVPCGGLNLQFVGTSVDGNLFPGGAGADVLGGIVRGATELTTFGAEGIANPTCTVGTAAGRGISNPYSKAAAGK